MYIQFGPIFLIITQSQTWILKLCFTSLHSNINNFECCGRQLNCVLQGIFNSCVVFNCTVISLQLPNVIQKGGSNVSDLPITFHWTPPPNPFLIEYHCLSIYMYPTAYVRILMPRLISTVHGRDWLCFWSDDQGPFHCYPLHASVNFDLSLTPWTTHWKQDPR